MKLHSLRINEVRDKLMAGDILTRIAVVQPEGLALNFVNRRMQFTFNTYGDKGGWIASDASFMVAGYVS